MGGRTVACSYRCFIPPAYFSRLAIHAGVAVPGATPLDLWKRVIRPFTRMHCEKRLGEG